jgi:dUTP pyrophosphatase
VATLKYQIMPGCPVSTPIKPPAYDGDVGYDLAAAIRDESMELKAHEFTDVPTYVRVELPPGYWGDLRTRSSTFAKRRLLVMPGTIDNGYRGMLSILLFNPNPHPVTIHQGDYLAQIVLQPIVTPSLERVYQISESQRGDKGFGSSGGFKVPPDDEIVAALMCSHCSKSLAEEAGCLDCRSYHVVAASVCNDCNRPLDEEPGYLGCRNPHAVASGGDTV